MIPVQDRDRTLVVLDDHTSVSKRLQHVLRHGFVHLWFDDNWKDYEPYSFNSLCSPLPDSAASVSYRSAAEHIDMEITVEDHQANVRFLLDHLDVYFEFPALWDGCDWGHEALLTDKRQ